MDGPTDPQRSLPESWRHDLLRQLQPGESVVAWLEPDLDQRLAYAKRLVVLTDRRIIGYGETESSNRSAAPVAILDSVATAGAHAAASGAASVATVSSNGAETNGAVWSAATNGSTALAIEPASEPPAPPPPGEPAWQAWPLDDSLTVECRDRGGAGSLEIVAAGLRLCHWRYTPVVAAAAHQFAARVAAARQKSSGAATTVAVCPSCGSPITSDDGVCQSCSAVLSPPAISSLYRLIGFARPWAMRIALGFGLTLAGTAASLIPPYLTKPLVDDVLFPFQNGHPVNKLLAAWLLLGFVGAALVAWLLEWPRMYVLAWVSERISADLRNKTYSHLQWLSLEFFGGKRTGDLIARIGSDTERINNFLSINLVSFGSDLIMIVMTAALMLTMDARLAIVSLVPFPLIVWLVYRVRARLRRGFRQASVAWGEMTSVLADTIPGVRVVKAFAQESRDRPLRPQQSPRCGYQRPRERHLVVFRADGAVFDSNGPADGVGVWLLAGVS